MTSADWGLASPAIEFENYGPFIGYQIHKVNACNFEAAHRYPDRRIDYWVVDSVYFPDQYRNQSNRVLLTNCVLDKSTIDDRVCEIIPPSFYGIYAGRPQVKDQPIERDFNCFINRMDTNRQSWFYLLLRQELLTRGYVSFNMNVSRHPSQSDGFRATALDIFEQQFEKHHKGVFDLEHVRARSLVPYRNFNCDIETAILRSKVSLILETTFWTPHCTCVTEKIMRCLRLPRPWVVFGNVGTVGYLRSLGFDVLDDMIDHSYDIEHDWIIRQQKVLDQLVKAFNTLDSYGARSRWQQAANHNLGILDAWRDAHMTDFDQSLDRAYQKLLAL